MKSWLKRPAIAGAAFALAFTVSAVLADAITGLTAADYLIVISYSHADGKWYYAKNSATRSEVTTAFAASLLDATGKLTLGAESDGGAASGADFDWYGVAMGNVPLTDTISAQLCTYYEAQHQKDYCP